MNHIQKKKLTNLDRKEFGKRIKQIRTLANITSNQLGNYNCKVDPAFIRQIESGSRLPSIPLFVKICNSLQISPCYLLEKEISIQNEFSDWNELIKLTLQIPPVFRQIIYDVLCSLTEHLAETKKEPLSLTEEFPTFKREEFGRRLCKVREEMKLTPQQLAISCGITPTFIHQIEAGNKLPGLSIFTSLCNALKVSPAYLLGNELKITSTSCDWKEFERISYDMTPKAQKITIDIISILIQNFTKI